MLLSSDRTFQYFRCGKRSNRCETTKCGVGIQFPDCPLIPRHIFCSGSPISEHIRVLMPCVPHFLCEKFFYIVFCADYNVNFNTVPIRVTGANNPLTYFVLLCRFFAITDFSFNDACLLFLRYYKNDRSADESLFLYWPGTESYCQLLILLTYFNSTHHEQCEKFHIIHAGIFRKTKIIFRHVLFSGVDLPSCQMGIPLMFRPTCRNKYANSNKLIPFFICRNGRILNSAVVET